MYNISINPEIYTNNGGGDMPTIAPISELRNYGQVLEKVKPNSPVYLTKNGRGAYSVHRIEDDEELEKARAMVKLLSELNRGFALARRPAGCLRQTSTRILKKNAGDI